MRPSLLLFALVSAACAGGHRLEPESPSLAGWFGPPPRMAIFLEGPDVDSDKRATCARVAADAHVAIDFNATVQVSLVLGAHNENRLRIVSRRFGPVLDEHRSPNWSTEDLCRDAIAHALPVAKKERLEASASPSPVAPVAAPPALLSLYRPDVYRGRHVDIFVTIGKEIVRLRNGQLVTRTIDSQSTLLLAGAGGQGKATTSLVVPQESGAHTFARCTLVPAGGWAAQCELVSELEGQAESASLAERVDAE